MVKKIAKREAIYFEISSQTEMAKLLDCSSKSITEYNNEGLMVKAPGRGRYYTQQSMNNVLKKFRDAARGQRNTTTSYQIERTKTESIRRQKEEILLAQAKGTMLTLDEVVENWTNFGRIIKVRVMGLPTKLRATIPHLTDHDGETIRTECREMLSEMAAEVDDSVIAADPQAISSE